MITVKENFTLNTDRAQKVWHIRESPDVHPFCGTQEDMIYGNAMALPAQVCPECRAEAERRDGVRYEPLPIGTRIKVRIADEKQCFPPDGELIATIDQVFSHGVHETKYLISWRCTVSAVGQDLVCESAILEVVA